MLVLSQRMPQMVISFHDNPRYECTGGLRQLGLCVCLSVSLLSHISPLERLFILKIMSRTQWTTEVK